MKKTLHKARISLLISGICSLVFGVAILAFPAIPVSSLVLLFAAYMFLKGAALSIGAWKTRQEEKHWLFLMAYGTLNVITGIIASVYTEITMVLFGFIASINLLIGGILQIIMAIHLHREIKRTGWLVFSGVITLVAGTYIYMLPRIEPLTILYLIAAAAIMVSLFLIALSFKAIHWHPHPFIGAAMKGQAEH